MLHLYRAQAGAATETRRDLLPGDALRQANIIQVNIIVIAHQRPLRLLLLRDITEEILVPVGDGGGTGIKLCEGRAEDALDEFERLKPEEIQERDANNAVVADNDDGFAVICPNNALKSAANPRRELQPASAIGSNRAIRLPREIDPPILLDNLFAGSP